MDGLGNQICSIDKETFLTKHWPRLRAAHVEGFEGVRSLNLKLNRKRKEEGKGEINLAEECAGDLELRKDDMYDLFLEMVQIYYRRYEKGERIGRAPQEPQEANVWDSHKALN